VFYGDDEVCFQKRELGVLAASHSDSGLVTGY
jgi:hypothetical protein